MNFFRRSWWVAGVAWLCATPALIAQTPEAPPALMASLTPAGASAKSPVDTFRELLAMTPAERRTAIADRPPEVQRQILAKIREYSALRPNDRDVRLEVTQLYYYLWPLMRTPATNRTAQLALVPATERQKVEARLKDWDKLPAIKQQELLTNALAARYFIELQNGPPIPAPGKTQDRLGRGIQAWRTLPEDQRKQITARFNQFFNLTETEKQKTLNTLSEPEREQIQKTLSKFVRLTPAEREDLILCFEKFADLTPAERGQFMKKAERWSALSSDERQEWRQLVDDLSRKPPMPPGLIPPTPGDEE